MVSKKSKHEEIKEEKRMELGNVKSVEGYIAYDKVYEEYYSDNSGCWEEEIEYAFVFPSLDDAQKAIEEEDEPENCEIHKVKFTYEVEAIYERNIVWNVAVEKVEDN